MKTGPRSYRRRNAFIGIFHVLLYLTLTVFGFAGTTLPAREQPGEADQGANQGFEEFPLRGNEVLTTKSLSEEVTYRSRYVSDRGFNRLAGNIVVPTLLVYRPVPERNRGVGLVICPGGGHGKVRRRRWNCLSWKKTDTASDWGEFRNPRDGNKHSWRGSIALSCCEATPLNRQ